MTELDQIDIQYGLPDNLRGQAARLYFQAFERKFRPGFGTSQQGLPVLEESLNLSSCLAAIANGSLVGIVGLKFGDRCFVDARWSSFRRHYGLLVGTVRLLLLAVLDTPASEGELALDGIVVDASRRGQGIGSRLLEKVTDFARDRGFKRIRLEVVDTNPKARSLYERMGFRVRHIGYYPYLRWLYGFSGALTMVKESHE